MNPSFARSTARCCGKSERILPQKPLEYDMRSSPPTGVNRCWRWAKGCARQGRGRELERSSSTAPTAGDTNHQGRASRSAQYWAGKTELVFASFLINVLYNSVFLDQSVAVHNESTYLRSGSLLIMHREKEYCRIISDVR